MEIRVNNIQELLIGMIGLCGEIPKDTGTLNELIGMKRATINWAKSVIKKDGVITISKVNSTLRLRNPAGTEWLRNISSVMYTHYMLLTNDGKMSVTGSGKKKAAEYAFVFYRMLLLGCYFDNIRLKHVPNNFGQEALPEDDASNYLGELANINRLEMPFPDNKDDFGFDALVSNIPDDDSYFYSARIIKACFDKNSRISSSKMSGMLLANKNGYIVYTLKEPGETCFPRSEKTVSHIVSIALQKAYGINDNKTNGMFFIPNFEMAADICETKGNAEITPRHIYDRFIVLPDGHEKEIFDIITKHNWQKRLNELIYKNLNAEPGNAFCDAIIRGIPSVELLSCDLKKVVNVRRLSSKHIHVICYDWQKETLTKCFRGYKVDFTVLPAKDSEKILVALDE